MSNHFGRSGFQPNSGIGRDPNSESYLQCTASAETYHSGVYGTLLSESSIALFNEAPNGPAIGSTATVDPPRPDQLGFMEAWHQDGLMNASYSNPITDGGNWSLQFCPGTHQHEGHTGSGSHEHHFLPGVVSQPDYNQPDVNHDSALIQGNLFNDEMLMQQQLPFHAFHQDIFPPPATLHHQERRDHDAFPQNDLTMTNSLAIPALGYQAQLDDVMVFGNGSQGGMLPQYGVQPVADLQQSEPHTLMDQTGIGYSFGICDQPETFAQNIPIEVLATTTVKKKRSTNVAKRPQQGSPSQKDWESKKLAIEYIWYKQNHTTDELIKEMADFYNFHASKTTFKRYLKSWNLWKNMTKKNQGKEKYGTGDSETSARKRPAQRLPKTQNYSNLQFAPKITLVPMLLEDNGVIPKRDLKMSHDIRCMAESFFDLSRWTADPGGIILVPPRGGVDTSKIWQTLLYQSYSAAILSRMKLFKKVNLCLERFASSIDQATKHCDPNFLIYFWRICISLNAVRLPGKLKREPFVLLQIFFKQLERSFTRYHGNHGIIEFLRSLTQALKHNLNQILKDNLNQGLKDNLNQVLKNKSCRSFRRTLDRTYQYAIYYFSELLGDGHATVLGMRRHYNFQFTAKDRSGRVSCEVDLAAAYRSLLCEAELKYGQLGEQTISVLYDYASVMSPRTIDLEWVETLHERSAQFCRDHNVKTYNLATRALVFSTELLANDYISKDRNRSLDIMEDAIELLKQGDQDCQVWARSCSKTAVMRQQKKKQKRKPSPEERKEKRAAEQARLAVLRSGIEGGCVVEEQPPKGHIDRQREQNKRACKKFQSSVLEKLKPTARKLL
ncbi:hypothetical protein IFR05_015281 [Cadophora sp. M221]|nr:hypothetical protein IFR05_015281 [Cadophora sp. M221]